VADTDPFLTVAEAAEVLRVSRDTILRAVHAGRLTAFVDGRTVRIRASALEAYIQARSGGTAASRRPGRASRG
jgi:excisionase family DNA binding protein